MSLEPCRQLRFAELTGGQVQEGQIFLVLARFNLETVEGQEQK